MARDESRRRDRGDREDRESEFIDKLVHINRVAKVEKGGRRFGFEALGVGDVVAKSLGTSNPYNMVRATFDALKSQQSPRMVAQRRGRSVSEIIARREGASKGEQASAS